MFQQTSDHESSETWQRFMELRSRREVIERWLTSCSLPDNTQQNLRAMLRDVEDQLQALTDQLGMCKGNRL
jgi:hypothetical protein